MNEMVHMESFENTIFSFDILKDSGFFASSSNVLRSCFFVLCSIELQETSEKPVIEIIAANNTFFITFRLTVLRRAWLLIAGAEAPYFWLIGAVLKIPSYPHGQERTTI